MDYTQETKTQWIDVAEIQKKYLPVSKKAIRSIIRKNLDYLLVGNKILVEKQQLLQFLRKEW